MSAAAVARVDKGGFVVFEFLPLLLRELPADPVIDVGKLLIQLAEPGILANRFFVGGTRVAAIEALRTRRGREPKGDQQYPESGGEMRRQRGAA